MILHSFHFTGCVLLSLSPPHTLPLIPFRSTLSRALNGFHSSEPKLSARNFFFYIRIKHDLLALQRLNAGNCATLTESFQNRVRSCSLLFVCYFVPDRYFDAHSFRFASVRTRGVRARACVLLIAFLVYTHYIAGTMLRRWLLLLLLRFRYRIFPWYSQLRLEMLL